MKLPVISALLFVLSSPLIPAAVIQLPNLSTSWAGNGLPPFPTRVVSNTEIPVNLDDRSGLTPGLPVRLTLTPGFQPVWIGGFCVGAGPAGMTVAGYLRLIVGSESVTAPLSLFQNLTSDMGLCPVGIVYGEVALPLTLVVPWSADLASARLEVAQDATITGNTAHFTSSGLHILPGSSAAQGESLSMSLTSVPEPAAAPFLFLTVMALRRRKRAMGCGAPAPAGIRAPK